MKSENPYKECEKCKTIADCPHPDVTMDGMSLPMPPEVCIKPMDILKETYKKRKNNRNDSSTLWNI